MPVRLGALLLSGIKIEAFSSFVWGVTGVWKGVIAPTSSRHLLCLFTLSLVPFFGVSGVFKSLAMPLMPFFDFPNMHGINKLHRLQRSGPPHLLPVTNSEVFPIVYTD